MPFTSTPSIASNTVVAPRVNTRIMEVDDFWLERDIMRGIQDTWSEGSFLDMLALTDREVMAKNPRFYHYENNLLFRPVKIATVVGTATASSAVVTLTADSYSLKGGKNYSPLQATDFVMLEEGQWAYVTNKTSVSPTVGYALTPTGEDAGTPSGTATQYTLVRANGSTYDLGARVTALAASGDPIAIPSDGHAEGSFQPIETLISDSTRFQGQMQILKGHAEITGTADAVWETEEINGTVYRWNRMIPEALAKFRGKVNYTFLYSPGGTFTNTAGEEIRTTKGLEGYIRDLGHNYSYTEGSFSVTDLDAIVAKIKQVWGGKEYFWVLGPELRGQVEEVLKDYPQNNVQFNVWGNSNPKQKMIDLGVNSFHYKGVTFHFMEVMLHPSVDGLPTYNYTKTGFLIPGDGQNIAITDDNGIGRKLTVPSAAVRYLSQSVDGSRRFKSKTATFDNNGTNGRDVVAYDCLAELGLQLVGLRKFIRIYPV